jgi:hypothetical protein
MDYQAFLNNKHFRMDQTGFDVDLSEYPLMDYQQAITAWALRRGRAAIFADTGLGKTIMQLVWAAEVAKHTGGEVLILAPLAVSSQTIEEAKKFGIPCGEIINYEQLHNIDPGKYVGVVLDESSILKGFDGKVRRQITESFANTPYKLSCTATPSPNDFMELGTQSEFLGIMSQTEMLAMFFIHDGSDTSKWRLKGHGRKKFFEWLAAWSVFISKPSDLGFADDKHDLPPLHYHEHIIDSGIIDGLFAPIAQGLQERNTARRDTVDARVQLASEIANEIDGQVLIWCHLNDESQKLTELIAGCVEVTGSDKPEHKIKSMLDFSHGELRAMTTKPKIAGFGMNWQSCNHMVFVGLSDSWEQFYQAVRRCWRFGQKKPVHVHIISADIEGATLVNIKRKEAQNAELKAEMIAIMKDKTMVEIGRASTQKTEYAPKQQMESPAWL